MRGLCLALVVVSSLGACGSGTESGVASAVLSAARNAVPLGQAPDRQVQPTLSRAVLERVGQPVLVARIASRNATAGLTVAGRNGAYTTWITTDGISLTLLDGLLVETRGLGHDLMSADVAETRAGIETGRGESRRVHRYLDGENQLVPRTFVCALSSAGWSEADILGWRHDVMRVEETCQSPEGNFTNRYWIGRDGTIWRSRQFVGPVIGYVELDRAGPSG